MPHTGPQLGAFVAPGGHVHYTSGVLHLSLDVSIRAFLAPIDGERQALLAAAPSVGFRF